jgi:hypothetical protein
MIDRAENKRNQSSGAPVATAVNYQALQALWILSGFSDTVKGEELATIICEAPDPETASRVITSRIHISSDALSRKWRKVINDTWLRYHADIPSAFTLPLTSRDVLDVPALRDAYAVLEEISKKPVNMVWDRQERTIDPADLERLVQAMPSLSADNVMTAEHEWGYVPLRRLRAVLQALRLVRIYKDQLVVVKSRYDRFQKLPLPQQFYMLWHVDVYHIDWADYAGGWRPYIQVLQGYLPLIWDLHEESEEGSVQNIHDMTHILMEAFEPIWEQESIAGAAVGHRTFFDVYTQCALPAIAERLLIGDIFMRYGLVEQEASVHSFFHHSPVSLMENDGDVCWSRIGSAMIRAERGQELPCGMELLDD